MEFNKLPRKYLAGIIAVLVVILLMVTLWQPTSYRYRQEQVASTDDEAFRKEYAEYLASIKPDPDASKKLFLQLMDEKTLQDDIRRQLRTDQKITIPVIPDFRLAISDQAGEAAVTQYFTQLSDTAEKYVDQIEFPASQLFDQTGNGTVVATESRAFLNDLYKTPVPREVANFHKAEIASLETFVTLAKTAERADQSPSSELWPGVYRDYAIINDRSAVAKSEYDQLNQKYSLDQKLFASQNAKANFPLIKEAQAQFSAVIVGNVWEEIKDAAKAGIASAFAKFMNQYLSNFVTSLENNYKIANFMYYTDALVRGQYVNDYLDKYVSDPLDKQLITRFIPQFNCANNKEDLRPVFVAKGKEYLGFDPASIDPSSADFYNKLARLPDISPDEQRLKFEGTAQEAFVRANDAAILEQLSPTGLKAPRSDVVGKQIQTTLASLNGSLQAAFSAQLGLGTENSDSIIAKMVSSSVEQFTNKFVFKGVVLKEQNTCIEMPQLQPVIPGSPTTQPTF